MEIEADIAALSPSELEELIDRAVRPDVPLRVLFAALDRYTELLRPALDEEPGPAGVPRPATVPAVPNPPAAATAPAGLVLPVAPGTARPAGAPGPPE